MEMMNGVMYLKDLINVIIPKCKNFYINEKSWQ